MLDPLYLLATYGVIWWAFGWRALGVALLAFATNFPSRFYWTGGSFLRWDWLFYLVAGIACLKKDRPALGGAALAYATLLRVFPMLLLHRAGAGARAITCTSTAGSSRATRASSWGRRWPPRCWCRCSLRSRAACTAISASSQNTAKHKETPLTNYMGAAHGARLPAQRGRAVAQGRQAHRSLDPLEAGAHWTAGRTRPAVLRRSWSWASCVMIGLAARHVEPWVAAALGITFIPIGVELTCYYYAFIIGLGVLWTEREQVGRWLLFLTAYTQFAAWAPLGGMPAGSTSSTRTCPSRPWRSSAPSSGVSASPRPRTRSWSRGRTQARAA